MQASIAGAVSNRNKRPNTAPLRTHYRASQRYPKHTYQRH